MQFSIFFIHLCLFNPRETGDEGTSFVGELLQLPLELLLDLFTFFPRPPTLEACPWQLIFSCKYIKGVSFNKEEKNIDKQKFLPKL